MPKGKKHGGAGGGSKGKRAVARRERKAGLYLSPGDPDFKSLSQQLRVQGLALRDVPGDGNCLFRALAEQLDDHHGNLRRRVVEHIRTNSADYAPFLDEDTSFASYVDELSKDGTFVGNDAIVAVTRSCGVNVVIHQLGAPRWEVRPPAMAAKTLHIAYLRGEHYCSVQSLYPGQALPQLEPEARQQDFVHSASAKPVHVRGENSDVQCVLEATGCQDNGLAEQCLRESGGEISLAIVELLQIMSVMDHDSGAALGLGDVQVEDDVQLRPSKATTNPSAGKLSQLGPQHHLSNRERKEAAKTARKQATKEARQRKAVDRSEGESADMSNDSIGARTI